MKKNDNDKFVGVIIQNSKMQVFLQKRSKAATFLPELWCLPGGGIEQGESPINSAIREVYEETAILMDNLNFIVNIPSKNGNFVFFACDPTDWMPINTEPDLVDEQGFFDINHLPEQIVMESLIALFYWALNEKQKILSPITWVDRFFSGMFYSYLYSHISLNWSKEPPTRPLIHTILNTPYRKFKSCIPILLSSSSVKSIIPSLLSEVFFSTFYIFDDICDNKLERYKKVTALGKYGTTVCASYLFTFGHELDQWLSIFQASYLSRKTNIYIQLLAKSQIYRHTTMPIQSSLEQYCLYSASRTNFLKELWSLACKESDYFAESTFIERIYLLSAQIGQIKNDLKEINKNCENYLEDYYRLVPSALSILLYNNIIHEPEKISWLTKCWSSPLEIRKNMVSDYLELLRVNKIEDKLRELCAELLAKIFDELNNSGLIDQKKEVLSAWFKLQHKGDLSMVEFNVNSLESFFRAVIYLCYELQHNSQRLNMDFRQLGRLRDQAFQKGPELS